MDKEVKINLYLYFLLSCLIEFLSFPAFWLSYLNMDICFLASPTTLSNGEEVEGVSSFNWAAKNR